MTGISTEHGLHSADLGYPGNCKALDARGGNLLSHKGPTAGLRRNFCSAARELSDVFDHRCWLLAQSVEDAQNPEC